MKTILPLFTIACAIVAGLFGLTAIVLMGFALVELWTAVTPRGGLSLSARSAAIESIGMVAVALVALEMTQTRRKHQRTPS
jgi:hypothetical protein